MKIGVSFVLVSLSCLVGIGMASASTCVGEDPCRACHTCEYCKRCAKLGGSCGVCKGGRSAHNHKHVVVKVKAVTK